MPEPEILTGLSQIADRYDAVLCDIWGVIHNGRERFPDACAALTRFGETRGPVVLISNAARPSPEVTIQLDGLGVPREAWSGFVTSGDVTRPLLAARAPGRVWAIGPEQAGPLYEGLGLDFAGPADADFISCTGPEDDDKETPEDYRARLEIAARRGIPMICANPDIVVQRGSRLIYCGGALAALYSELGGEVVMAGKPHAPIYASALAEADRLGGKPLDPARILCIGDGLPTDVRGANRENLACLFIANGIHAVEASDDRGRLDPARLSTMMSQSGVYAAYALAALVW